MHTYNCIVRLRCSAGVLYLGGGFEESTLSYSALHMAACMLQIAALWQTHTAGTLKPSSQFATLSFKFGVRAPLMCHHFKVTLFLPASASHGHCSHIYDIMCEVL